MRYFVNFIYNGTSFHGSQTQPNGITVQQVMEETFSTILRQPIALTFAGRTDAGVHALSMVAHWDMNEPLSIELTNLVTRLNSLLPDTIAIRAIYPVSDDAHARFTAISRTYEYRVVEYKSPFDLNQSTYVAPGLDYTLMNEAATHLLGRHDFAAFCKLHTDVKTTFCNVTQAEWTVLGDGHAVFTITADRFLRNMVRAVVGTLFEVGRHKITIQQWDAIIASLNRCQAGQSAPPQGLFLTQITYPDTILL